MIKYLLSKEENIQSEEVNKWDYRSLKVENHYKFKKFITNFDKLIIPVADKKFVKNFLKQILSKQELKNIELVWELPHWIRSFLKYLIKWKFLDLPKYFKANTLILWGWEIFTEECRSGPFFFFITALPFWIKKLIFKILFIKDKLPVYLFWGIQPPYRRFNKILVNFWINQASWIFVRDFDSIETVCKIRWSNIPIEKKQIYWDFIKNVFFVFDHSFILFKNNIYHKKNKAILNNCLININPIWRKKFKQKYFNIIKQYKFDNIFYIPVNKLEDYSFYFLLKENLKNYKINLIDWQNWKDFVNFINSNIKIWIVTRLHMFLILYYLNKEIIVFPYQRKILKLCKVIKALKNLTNIREKIIIV